MMHLVQTLCTRTAKTVRPAMLAAIACTAIPAMAPQARAQDYLRGYYEGRRYWETGQLPRYGLRGMTSNELRGFLAGDVRKSQTPWQYDPAQQRGWLEGRIYRQTGIAPGFMSPAERRGFYAGQ